jgi:hypothetical protein
MAVLHDQWVFYVGDVWPIIGTMHNADGSVMDLTGATVQWRMVNAAGDVELDYAVGTGIVVTDAPNGVITITVPTADSADIAPGEYKDSCRVTVGGVPTTQSIGSITVRPSLFAP